MKYFILGYAGRLLFPCLIALSLIVLYRGHNLPGGGFIGGLMAATAYIIVGLGSATMQEAKAKLRVDPVRLLAVGLTIAIISGLPGMLGGDEFLTGEWLPTFSLPLLGKVHLGTPLVFDVGVYLVVIGFTLHTTFCLAELAQPDVEETSE